MIKRLYTFLLLAGALAHLAGGPGASAQTEETPAQELSARVAQMQARLDAAERQLAQYHTALDQMQQQLKALQSAPVSSSSAESSAEISHLQQAVADLGEEQAVQQTEIAVHDQTKVETRSRYSLHVGGLVLFNGFSNHGAVDRVDSPAVALARTKETAHSSLGASLRQTMLNFDVTGPDLWGAHSYASLQTDFFGGFSTADYSSTGSSLRLRTAEVQLAWPQLTARAGLSHALLTPFIPTSFATIADPALSWSGLLWVWIPQFSVEHPFSLGAARRLSVAAAAADIPDPGAFYAAGARPASAAERSGYPGAEARTAFSWREDGVSSVGVGGYWSPHSYGYDGSFDAWAAEVDWRLALAHRLEFTGQLYKGVGLGGLGGGTFKDVIQRSTASGVTQGRNLQGLRDQGGWAQLKIHPRTWVEFNETLGADNSSAPQLRFSYVDSTNPYAQLSRNQTLLSNVIFRPRAAIILSGEYRKLRSIPVIGPPNSAQIYSLSAGFEF